ncbi:MAG TPA: Nif3-like dinuclear metal center hexameric protein [Mycobacteriales bacterium]|nr:Nif3-like dinuclear metal center hexameric protein [Mycobacteriales bacterium]
MPSLADVVAAFERLYDPATAADWDAVGLVCGDPDAAVGRILFAVDPVPATAQEAIDRGADLLITHHPLLLRPVHGVPATTYKGRIVHHLIRAGVGLLVAHTNADVATPGVSDALIQLLGVPESTPLSPADGLGRVGRLPTPMTFSDFLARVADRLPATAGGVRGAGDPDRMVATVAVCGGAGDSLLARAAEVGADVYVTADLRHHPASEHRESGGPALIDVPHWASEWPWLADAAGRLRASMRGATVETLVSTVVTDPWTVHGAPAVKRGEL